NLPLERIYGIVADAHLECVRQTAFHHLCEASQLLLDRLGFPDKDLENAVFRALMVEEVVTEDFRTRLELAIDAAVALLHPARVPGHIEVKEVMAMALEVEPLAGCVGRDQDADRMLPRVGGEGALDLLALSRRRRPVIDGDPFRRAIGERDGGVEL